MSGTVLRAIAALLERPDLALPPQSGRPGHRHCHAGVPARIELAVGSSPRILIERFDDGLPQVSAVIPLSLPSRCELQGNRFDGHAHVTFSVTVQELLTKFLTASIIKPREVGTGLNVLRLERYVTITITHKKETRS